MLRFDQKAHRETPISQVGLLHFSRRADKINTRKNMPTQTTTISAAQLAANKQNAQYSTGATTPEGRAASSLNALRHGMCSMKALLPSDNAQAYEEFVASHFARHAPATDEESELVQLIANNSWRLLKVTPEEHSIIEYGRSQSDPNLFSEEKNPARRAALIEASINAAVEKRLHNLRLHERRIRKQLLEDLTRLKTIQAERKEKPVREAQEATAENFRQVSRILNIAQTAANANLPFNPADFGFVLSASEFAEFQTRQETHFRLSGEFLNAETLITAIRSTVKEAKAA